jgi:hypothetical protein
MLTDGKSTSGGMSHEMTAEMNYVDLIFPHKAMRFRATTATPSMGPWFGSCPGTRRGTPGTRRGTPVLIEGGHYPG